MSFGRGKYPQLRDACIAAGIDLAEDEPVFLLRAQDKFAPLAIRAYADLLQAAAIAMPVQDNPSMLFSAARDLRIYADDVHTWQVGHRELTKVPD